MKVLKAFSLSLRNSRLIKKALNKYYKIRIERLFPRAKFVFIISTMRSGSSLLQHLLLQDWKFIAHGETHITYSTMEDLKKLMFKVFYAEHCFFLKNKIIVEKCVHNEYIKTSEVLNSHNIKIIFLVREPKSVITSLYYAKGFAYSNSIDEASNYYKKRLEFMINLALSLKNPKNCHLVTYENLVSNTKEALNDLSKFLNLKYVLSETYPKQRWTKVAGKGDISENIIVGEILKNINRKEIKIHNEIIRSCYFVYTKAINTIRKCCFISRV